VRVFCARVSARRRVCSMHTRTRTTVRTCFSSGARGPLLRNHELVEIFFRNASSVTIQARNIFECRRILSSILVEIAWSDASIAIRVHGCEESIDIRRRRWNGERLQVSCLKACNLPGKRCWKQERCGSPWGSPITHTHTHTHTRQLERAYFDYWGCPRIVDPNSGREVRKPCSDEGGLV
jgi:hypothetical protein